jgi:hypothetical protein
LERHLSDVGWYLMQSKSPRVSPFGGFLDVDEPEQISCQVSRGS